MNGIASGVFFVAELTEKKINMGVVGTENPVSAPDHHLH